MSDQNTPEDTPDESPQAARAGSSAHLDADPRRSQFWSAVSTAAQYRWWILGATAALFLLAAMLFDVGVPRSAKIIGASAILSAILIGRPVWSRVKSLLWNPTHILLLDLDAEDRRGGGAWMVPASTFRDAWSCTEGSPYWLTPNLVVTRGVSFDEKTYRGTYRGTLSDAELLRSIEAIRTCRDQLEDDARKGRRLDAQGWVIVRRAAHAGVRKVIETFEAGTLPDKGDGLDAAITEALEDLGVDRDLAAVGEEDGSDWMTELDLDLDDVPQQVNTDD